MNYKVLYRKYRPSCFDEVVGQDVSIQLIKDSIINDKVSHAYIFSGPRGTGKTSTAKIFAKTINCLDLKDGNPCGKCANCVSFNQNNDVYEIDAASNNGVDQIREIIDNIKLSPINSRYKVYIIDEVHMLSTSAFNALLLTLEEPPSHVVFVLATTNIEDVPITVLSRCQRIDFHKISRKATIETIKKISNIEQISIDDAAIEEIADYSDGGLRDALSILDQLSKLEETINQQTVLDAVGLISNKNVDELFEAIETNNVDKILEFCIKVRNLSADLKNVVKKIIDKLKKESIKALKENKCSRLDFSKLKELCFDLSSLMYKVNINVDPYSLLELTLLSYVNVNDNRQIISKSVNESREENSNTTDNVVQSSSKPAENLESIDIDNLVNVRINNCFVGANKIYLEKTKELWKRYIKELKNKKIKGLLLDSGVVLSSELIFVLRVEFKDSADQINENLELIEDSFNQFANKSYKIIACDSAKWNIETENYRKNLKNNIKYEKMDEKRINNSNDLLDDIFSSQKIEIK